MAVCRSQHSGVFVADGDLWAGLMQMGDGEMAPREAAPALVLHISQAQLGKGSGQLQCLL